MALTSLSSPCYVGTAAYIRSRADFSPLESGLTLWLPWPFRRIENPCLNEKLPLSSFWNAHSWDVPLTAMQWDVKAHEEAHEGELDALVNSSCLFPADRQFPLPATWPGHSGCFSPLSPQVSIVPVNITWSRRITQLYPLNQQSQERW